MSGRGEIIPELAAILREIADRIDGAGATGRDAEVLRKLAKQAAGEDQDYKVKVHFARSSRPKQGGEGVNQRFALARKVKDHRERHGGSLAEAWKALDGTFGVGEETIRKAWQEMSPLLDLPENQRNVLLFFKRLAARGKVEATRTKRER